MERRDARMRRSRDFRETVSQGSRAGRPRVVIHVAYADEGGDGAPNVGFVVGSAVGGSVVRHRVTRRLRHILWAKLESLPAGSRVVVRALPMSADASSAELAADVDKALKRLERMRRGEGSG